MGEPIAQYVYPKNIGSDEYKNRQVIFIAKTEPSKRNRFNEHFRNALTDNDRFRSALMETEEYRKMSVTTDNELTKDAKGIISKAKGSSELKKFTNGMSKIEKEEYKNGSDRLKDENGKTEISKGGTKSETVVGIMLPLPHQIGDNQSHKWENTKGITGVMGDKLYGGLDKVGGTIGLKEGSAESIAQFLTQYTIGRQYIADPGSWQSYKGSEPRKFTFSYDFVPQSHEEAEQILKIIDAFKKYSSPVGLAYDTVLGSPYFWDIQFNNETISNIISMDNVVITELQFVYGSDGNFSLFSDGMPKQISMTLSISETTPPYRSDYDKTDEKSRSTSKNNTGASSSSSSSTQGENKNTTSKNSTNNKSSGSSSGSNKTSGDASSNFGLLQTSSRTGDFSMQNTQTTEEKKKCELETPSSNATKLSKMNSVLFGGNPSMTTGNTPLMWSKL